jgi:hypothetical protein
MKPSRAAAARCFTDHGLSAYVGSAQAASGDAIDLGGVVVPGVDPSSAQFQRALEACGMLLPGGRPPQLSQAERAEAAKAMLAFAACMRGHGLPSFPDPDAQGIFPAGGMQGIDPQSPIVQRAFAACVSLEPKVGPRLQL